MIVLFTDYGFNGPYVGQLKCVLATLAPGVPVIDLFADAPRFQPMASAYLLAAYARGFPSGTVFLAVVDPGVGTHRPAAAVLADDRWFIGPENGLFEMVVRRAAAPARWWRLDPPPMGSSATFHGRDVFAPVAAGIAMGTPPRGEECPVDEMRRYHWPDELSEIIYIDAFGNAMSGLSAPEQPEQWSVRTGQRRLGFARTFAAVPLGEAFWYVNSNGLIEIAVNHGSAAADLALEIGSKTLLVPVGSKSVALT